MRMGQKIVVKAYMTVEAALVMSVVMMVYVFLIDSMLLQYERCVKELEGARKSVLMVEEETMYEITSVDPLLLLRLQRTMILNLKKEEEKVE